MAKNTRKQPQETAKVTPRAGVQKVAGSAAVAEKSGKPSFFKRNMNQLIALAAVLITTIIALKSSVNNQFTNWDDPGYVKDNALVKSLSAENIKLIFSTPIMGNYHPLTILSLAFDYSVDALNPYPFHFHSLVYHLITTLLVFVFVQVLTKRTVASFITALLFGIHPMHIESVAWIAGRKDVLYGIFYMAACIFWVYYSRAEKNSRAKWYILVVLSFLLSLISKPVAVSLPVTLLAIDYFMGRLFAQGSRFKVNTATLIEKIPLFVISVGFGIKSMKDQQVFGALGTQGEKFNFVERIGLGGYALVTYLWKAVAPVKLLCFYPYPLKQNGHLEYSYYIYPVVVLLLAGIIWYFLRKNKAMIFGLLFFIINIALLLQFIPVGGAIVADRYSYIPYLGLFFMLGWAVSEFWESEQRVQMGKMLLGAVLVYSLVLAWLSNERCKVWYDGVSLWRDEIEIEPIRAPNGWNNLGFFYFTKFNATPYPNERKLYYDSAYFLLTRAIQLQPTFVNPYISLGELLRSNNQLDEAMSYYYKALKLDTGDMAASAYLGMGIVHAIRSNFDSSDYCFRRTLAKRPYNPEAHSNYANLLDMTHHVDSAIKHYGIAIEQNPDMYAPYLNRARAYQRNNRCAEAYPDFEKAIQLEPQLGEIYYARSQCYYIMGNMVQAKNDVAKAQSLGFNQMDPNYLSRLK